MDKRHERLSRERKLLIDQFYAAQTSEEKAKALARLHVLDEEIKERGDKAC